MQDFVRTNFVRDRTFRSFQAVSLKLVYIYYAYIYTYVHTYLRTYIHTYIHTHTNLHITYLFMFSIYNFTHIYTSLSLANLLSFRETRPHITMGSQYAGLYKRVVC